MTDPDAGLAAREAALDFLAGALDKRGGLDEALSRPAPRLWSRATGFARALAMAALRRLGPSTRRCRPS